MIMEREGRFVASHLGGLAVGLTLIAGTVLAQPPQLPRFQASVDVTSVDVTVVDSGGRPVMNLQPGDFTRSHPGYRAARRQCRVGVACDARTFERGPSSPRV